MENSKSNSFSSQIQLLLDNEVEFQQELKQHILFKSDQVSNPFKFITGLLSKGVLCHGSNESDETLGLKQAMVRLAMIIACGKGSDGISGLVEALEESGNMQITCDFRAWFQQNFGVETESTLGEPIENDASAQSKQSKVLTSNIKETSSCGTKLINEITSRVEDDFLQQLQGHLVSKSPEIANVTEFCASLVRQKVLDETDVQLTTEPGIQDGQDIEKVMKATCSKRAFGSLVIALQSSNNEQIIAETLGWLQTSQVRQNNYPISVKSLARERVPTATGLFAATWNGLISLNLRTLEATILTSEFTFAVAVNQNLGKVYWTESSSKSRIMRSNFDGSAKEVIVPPGEHWIDTLAIDERSGNVYFAPYFSHEIKVCNARGENLTVVLSNSPFVKYVRSIACDSEKGLIYWTNEPPPRSDRSLVRANWDGSNPEIVSTGSFSIHSLTLDQPSNDVIYWADESMHTIGSIDADGNNMRTLVELEGEPRPNGIQVDAHKIYFSNYYTGTIQSVNRDSGQELATIFETTTGRFFDLALFNALTK